MDPLVGQFAQVNLAEDGDLIIRIPETNDPRNGKQFLVDSNAVSRASKELQNLMAGKHEGPGLMALELTGDIASHAILLPIMHGNFAKVPFHLSGTELFQLLKVAGRYKLKHLLRPWIATWIEPYQDWPGPGPHLYDSPFMEKFYKRIWIAWVLGEKEHFRHLTSLLIKQAYPSGDEFVIAGVPLRPRLIIPGLYEYIVKEHDKKVDQIFNAFEHELDVRMDKSTTFCSCPETPSVREKFMCDAIVERSVLRCYTELKRDTCLDGKRKELECMELLSFPHITSGRRMEDHFSGASHESCNPKTWLLDEYERLMSDIASSLDKKQEKYLDYTQSITGVLNDSTAQARKRTREQYEDSL
ncbi:uncharacterized protein PG998_009005 [Apiospora kogelbergensis]|uniref:uncharacterized protein n=1 Tax=Apiospora kogelbergensis TaxID=1337665 RepID=UPI00313172E5